MVRLISGILFTALLLAAERGEEIKLWPGGAPGAENAPDVSQPSDNPKLPKRFTVVHAPSIYVFLPPKDRANGTAVVIAPGGGHSQLVIDKEGWDIADWFNRQGVAAFVLKYRLAKAKESHYTVAGDAMADAARAMRLVRSRAAEWGVNPARIGFAGFSAGGEVAALAETRFDAGNAAAADPIDRASSRPDFAIVVYPGFTVPISVPKDAPPTFLVCADDDRSHIKATTSLYLSLFEQGVSAEMHIYAGGGHGFGMRDSKLPVASWPERLKEWMADRKLVTQ